MLREVVVYLEEDYSVNESIWVDEDATKEEIREQINEKFNVWYYFDILDK